MSPIKLYQRDDNIFTNFQTQIFNKCASYLNIKKEKSGNAWNAPHAYLNIKTSISTAKYLDFTIRCNVC